MREKYDKVRQNEFQGTKLNSNTLLGVYKQISLIIFVHI